MPEGPLYFLVAALTLVVVAVPEGLALASTMALACSVQALKRSRVRGLGHLRGPRGMSDFLMDERPHDAYHTSGVCGSY